MQLTGMELATLGWLAGLAAAAVTLLYILKLRKRRIEVPFSPLWRRILVEHKQQSDLWRRLRRLMSWLLHLLLVALLAFALADPHMENEVVEGRHIVLLIDSSGSMGATDVSGGADRLDVAKKRAHEILETMGPEDRVMLVNFNNQVQPLSPFVAEASVLEQPLRDIQLAATATAYPEALRFAADSLRDKSRAELVIISDGAGFEESAAADLELGPETTVRHLKIGESAGNLAITAFNVRRYLANKLDFELFIRVQSYFDRPINAEIEIHADGRLVDTKPISLEPNQVYQRFYPSQAVSGEKLEARVRLRSADARDVFPVDDRAFALLPPLEKTRVQIVTEGNLYIEGPLLLNPNLEVDTVAPGAYDPEKSYDVTIFDRVTPRTPPSGNFVFIDPQGEHSPWKVKGVVDDPIITRVRRSHPLLRWITLKDVNIAQASHLELGREDTVVAASAVGAPLLVTRKEGPKRMIGVSFDIRQSDFPLRVAFPVLVLNLIDYFTLDDDSMVENYATGEAWSIPVPRGVERATMTRPDGTTVEAAVYDGRAVVYGDAIGFYELQAGEERKRIAANLVNPVESRIGPSDIEIPSQEIVRDTSALLFDRHQLWIWAVLAALLLLLIEWWTYNRRITV